MSNQGQLLVSIVRSVLCGFTSRCTFAQILQLFRRVFVRLRGFLPTRKPEDDRRSHGKPSDVKESQGVILPSRVPSQDMILPSIEYQVSEKTNENLDVSFGAAVSRLESEDKHAPSHTRTSLLLPSILRFELTSFKVSASDSPQIEYHHGVTPYKPDEPNPRDHLPAAFPILHTAGSFGPKMMSVLIDFTVINA